MTPDFKGPNSAGSQVGHVRSSEQTNRNTKYIRRDAVVNLVCERVVSRPQQISLYSSLVYHVERIVSDDHSVDGISALKAVTCDPGYGYILRTRQPWSGSKLQVQAVEGVSAHRSELGPDSHRSLVAIYYLTNDVGHRIRQLWRENRYLALNAESRAHDDPVGCRNSGVSVEGYGQCGRDEAPGRVHRTSLNLKQLALQAPRY